MKVTIEQLEAMAAAVPVTIDVRADRADRK